jgi:hypothetical protein
MQIQGFEINCRGLLPLKANNVNTMCEDIWLNKRSPPSYNFKEERKNYGCYLFYNLPCVPYVLVSCKTASTGKYMVTLYITFYIKAAHTTNRKV